jgi:hypothetical protein
MADILKIKNLYEHFVSTISLLLHGDFSQNRGHPLSSTTVGFYFSPSVERNLDKPVKKHDGVSLFYRAMITSSRSSTYALSVSTNSAKTLYSFFSFFFLDEDL